MAIGLKSLVVLAQDVFFNKYIREHDEKGDGPLWRHSTSQEHVIDKKGEQITEKSSQKRLTISATKPGSSVSYFVSITSLQNSIPPTFSGTAALVSLRRSRRWMKYPDRYIDRWMDK